MYTASSALPKDRERCSGLTYWKFHQNPMQQKQQTKPATTGISYTYKTVLSPGRLSGIPSDAPLALKWSWATSEAKRHYALITLRPTMSLLAVGFRSQRQTLSPGCENDCAVQNDVIKVNGMSGRTSSAKVHFSPLMILAALLKATPTFNLARYTTAGSRT